jgi:hypothetical protein
MLGNRSSTFASDGCRGGCGSEAGRAQVQRQPGGLPEPDGGGQDAQALGAAANRKAANNL